MLKDRFFDCWADEAISVGSKFRYQVADEIESRIERGGYFLYFCTQATAKSEWCAAELRHTLERSGPKNRIIPVRVENAMLPVEVVDIQAFDLTPTTSKSADWLIDELIILLYKMISQNIRETAGELE